MSSLIEDLWIFSSDGRPLIEVFHNTQFDSALLGAFLAAMESFSKELSNTQLNNFSFGKKKFLITSCLDGNIFLVSQSDFKTKSKKIQKVFKIIAEFFEEIYSIEDIDKWDGDTKFFNSFKDRINLYFSMAEL
ncbi:MAG: hypothetical protein ACFFBP_00530 [Promethearchaeota archaeon]